MLFATWLSEQVAVWLAGLIPYVVYVLALTPTPNPIYEQPRYTPTPTATVYVYQGTTNNNQGLGEVQGSSGGTIQQWITSSNWPRDYYETLARIIMCESSGQTTARNGPHVGLLQVNGVLHGQVPNDPVLQLNQGYEVFKKQGWGAWECY